MLKSQPIVIMSEENPNPPAPGGGEQDPMNQTRNQEEDIHCLEVAINNVVEYKQLGQMYR